MEHSVAYAILKIHIEKNQLLCGYQDLVEWLERLHATAQITEAEIEDLLQRVDSLKIPNVPAGELVQ